MGLNTSNLIFNVIILLYHHHICKTNVCLFFCHKAIHEVGGRRIVVAGVPALGCCPSQLLAYQSNGSCVDYINDVSKDYNEHLLPEILSLNEKIPNATIMYINIYTSILNAAQHPTQFGKVKSS